MSSPASIKNHPIHPMLVALPIGLWVFALVCDIVVAAGGSPAWSTAGSYCVTAGIVGALLAAVPGFVDYLSIHEAEMKRIATYHMLINLGAVLIFAVNLWSRVAAPENTAAPLVLSIVGVIGILISGWLGGEMVYVKGMAVQAVEDLSRQQSARPPETRRAA